jgi:hypothetical protein
MDLALTMTLPPAGARLGTCWKPCRRVWPPAPPTVVLSHTTKPGSGPDVFMQACRHFCAPTCAK